MENMLPWGRVWGGVGSAPREAFTFISAVSPLFCWTFTKAPASKRIATVVKKFCFKKKKSGFNPLKLFPSKIFQDVLKFLAISRSTYILSHAGW